MIREASRRKKKKKKKTLGPKNQEETVPFLKMARMTSYRMQGGKGNQNILSIFTPRKTNIPLNKRKEPTVKLKSQAHMNA